MDYQTLRTAGIEALEQLSDSSWTDFNTHDPGITLLEQFAFALTDLGYRIGYEVPDLLATGRADPYESLHRPEQVLTNHPVTAADLRRLVLDVDGVKNAWIEAVVDADPTLHYHPGRQELSLQADPPATEALSLKGLYRVLVEKETNRISPAGLRGRVVAQLHANRPLCEDFAAVRVLDDQLVQIDAAIEIGPGERPEVIMLDALAALSDHISPPLQFTTLDEATREGVATDELFDGPLLSSGYLDPAALAASERRSALRTSDLIHALMDLSGVTAVTRIATAAGGPYEPWALSLDPLRVAQLDVAGTTIELTQGGAATIVDVQSVKATFESRRQVEQSLTRSASDQQSLFEPTPGRDRSVGRYHSLQYHLPALYGIGESGLPDSATKERKAQAKQLKAYLLIFDQLLANEFAQLANVADLFSFQDSTQTYFAGTVEDDGLGLDEVRTEGYQDRANSAVEPPTDRLSPGGPTHGRRNRFVDHLLARFAEQFSQHSVDSSFIDNKLAFLDRYPRVSSARGIGANALHRADEAQASGLADRVSLKLGLTSDRGENFVIVEHILLRPIDEDRPQELPVLTSSPHRDPYSLQLSFVFATGGRFDSPAARRSAASVVREETPAHLTPYVQWLDPDRWLSFKQAHDDWHDRRQTYLANSFGVESTHALIDQ